MRTTGCSLAVEREIYRIYVEKKPEFAVEAAGVLSDLQTVLMLDCVTGVRVVNRYDVIHPVGRPAFKQHRNHLPDLPLQESGACTAGERDHLPGALLLDRFGNLSGHIRGSIFPAMARSWGCG